MTTQLQVRNDTASNWTTSNPTLLSGELGAETDTLKLKVGNGTLTWGDLAAIPTEQIVVLNTAYTLTSQTAAQKLFNNTTNGALTLPVGTYYFECFYSLSSMSATSGSFGFALGGTATSTRQWWSLAQKGTATLSTATATQSTYNTAAANTTLATASTNTVGYAHIRGIINVTVAGTIIPQVSLGVAAAAVVGVGSYFKISPAAAANSTTNVTIGNWS